MKNKVNILFMVDKSGFGGVQSIAKDLMQKDFEKIKIYFFFLRNINSKSGVKDFAKNNVFYSRFSRKWALGSFWETKKLIENKEIAVLHLNGDKAIIYGVILKLIFFPNLKLIHHEHSTILKNNLIYNLLLFFSQRRINLFLAVSKYTKKRLIERAHIDDQKITVLYNFVNFSKIKKVNRRSGSDKVVLGFVGRLVGVKGCKYLIKTLPLLTFNFEVLIVGDGPLMKKLKKLVEELNLYSKVKFLGYVNNDDIFSVYSLFDILVIPSLREASPMVFYEAQAIGIPIVASNVAALNELVENNVNGLLFKTKNHKDLADKINLLAANRDLREKLSQNARKMIIKYSLKTYISKLEEIYFSL